MSRSVRLFAADDTPAGSASEVIALHAPVGGIPSDSVHVCTAVNPTSAVAGPGLMYVCTMYVRTSTAVERLQAAVERLQLTNLIKTFL